MYGFLIAMTVGVLTGLGLSFGGVCGIGWSIGLGVVAFVVAQVVLGRIIQKRVKEAMDAVQGVLLEGQKRLQAKMARWQMRPPGSIQAAQAEIARDQKVFVREALEQTEVLHKFDNWVPMMKRQIATAQFQLHWMIKDFKKVDELMPKALFLDPTTNAMKLARMYMTDQRSSSRRRTWTARSRRSTPRSRRATTRRSRRTATISRTTAWRTSPTRRSATSGTPCSSRSPASTSSGCVRSGGSVPRVRRRVRRVLTQVNHSTGGDEP